MQVRHSPTRTLGQPGAWLLPIALLLHVSVSTEVGAGLIDGRLTPDEYAIYSHYLSIQWTANTGETVSGGLLALGTDPDTGNHLLYYQLPVDFKDNTWGSDQVGNYNSPHRVQKIHEGDAFGGTGNGNRIVIRPTGNVPVASSGTIEFNVDLLASSAGANHADISLATGQLGATFLTEQGEPSLGTQNNGNLLGVGSNPDIADNFISVASSTSWNINHFGPNGLGLITQAEIDSALSAQPGNVLPGLLRDSPQVFTTVDATGNFVDSGYTRLKPGDPDSPIIDYDNVLSAHDDWWFPASFELALAANVFPNGEWTSAESINALATGNFANALIEIPRGGHISPNKLGASTLSSPAFDPLPPPTPNPAVPEPTTIAIWSLLGAAAIGLNHRRTRRTA